MEVRGLAKMQRYEQLRYDARIFFIESFNDSGSGYRKKEGSESSLFDLGTSTRA